MDQRLPLRSVPGERVAYLIYQLLDKLPAMDIAAIVSKVPLKQPFPLEPGHHCLGRPGDTLGVPASSTFVGE